MNIAVDIDDTLTDTFDYYIPFVAEFFGARRRRAEREKHFLQHLAGRMEKARICTRKSLQRQIHSRRAL